MLRRLSRSEVSGLMDGLKRSGIPFRSRRLAESFLFHKRNADLRELLELMRSFPRLGLDFTPQSLKRLESLYLEITSSNGRSSGMEKERLEELITQYMRHVFVHKGHAEWMVYENDYADGRYELGIRFRHGNGSTEHYAAGLDRKIAENGRNYLYNTYMMCVPDEKAGDVQ